jgi:hypothetical protein
MMRHQAGLGKFEFAVVLAIFGVLATLLLDRLVDLEHETERIEVDLILRHIDIGLKLAIGERMMRGEEVRIPALLESNPLDFLGTPPARGWNYDDGSRTLSYRPRQPEAFDGRALLAWRYVGRKDELGRTVGLRLDPVGPSSPLK